MAGPNNNNNPRSNYFMQNIQKSGETFLEYKNSRDIYFDSPSIFRQLSRKQIDLERYGHFFQEVNFRDACISAAQQRALESDIAYNGIVCMIQMYNGNVHPATHGVMESHRKASIAYNLIFTYLSEMRRTGDINWLYALVTELSRPELKNAI